MEHKTATKTTRHNASFEEEFRLYSSQSTPSFAEVRPTPPLLCMVVEEEEEGLYLQLETRERVQTNEAKSKRRRASPT